MMKKQKFLRSAYILNNMIGLELWSEKRDELSMKLLYCAFKQNFIKKDENYYSTGSFPDFLPSLSKFFEKVYLMVPVGTYMVDGVSKLTDTPQLEVVETKMHKNTYLRHLQSYFWSFENILRFMGVQHRADVVLLAIPASVTCLAYIPIINKPLVTLIAGDEQEVLVASNSPVTKIEHFIGFWKIRELIEKYLVKKSDVIICRNHKFKEKLIRKYNVIGSDVHVITSGVKTNIFKPMDMGEKEKIRRDLGLKNDDIVMGFVATHISHSKGADSLMGAFEMLEKEHSNVKLLLIGDDMIGIHENASIIYCGLVKREKLPNYYNAMDIFVFPSRSEGAPKVVMEACACGIPVISTNVGGIPELIKEGKTGFTVDPGDVCGIADCCRLLIEDEKLSRVMGRKAREYAVEKFDFDYLVEKTTEVIKSQVKNDER